MNKVLALILSFASGMCIAGIVSVYIFNKASEVLVFETSLTNQKISLETLRLIHSGKLDEVRNIHENMVCSYFLLQGDLSDTEMKIKTRKYFDMTGRQLENECGNT